MWSCGFLAFLRFRQTDRSRLMAKQLSVAVVKYLQQQYFSEEIKVLEERSEGSSKNRKGGVPKGNKLQKLSPILIDGILRVGGALERSTISFSAKHPMILPQHHHMTELIICHYHEQEGHMGPSQVLAIDE